MDLKADTLLKLVAASKDATAIYIAVGIFGAGILLALVFHGFGLKDPATTLMALLLIPLVAYGIASGKITEFSGPGGINAKFQAAAKQNIEVAATSLTDSKNQLQKVEKKSSHELKEIISKLEKGRPVALTLRFGKANYYERSVVEQYVRDLLEFDSEMVIVIVRDSNDEFIAMIDANSFLALSRSDEQQLINAVGDGNINYLKESPLFLFEGILDHRTNADALRKMAALNTKTLVVLNDQKQPHAIVKRDDIVAQILERLVA